MAQVVTNFRVRIYQAADGTIEVLLGSDQIADPSWKLLKDQDVIETKVISDHVESAAKA